MSKPALSVENLSYSYGARAVLDGFSCVVQSGRCTMLLGPNGAGKTTLFSLIVGLLAPQGGSIHHPNGGLAKIGIVFQQPALDADLSVEQNLSYYGGLHGLRRLDIQNRIAPLAARFDMQSRLKDKVRTLNGGHKRRVEIMRALLTEPVVLLLDEPTSGLDIPTRDALVRDMHDLCADKNIAMLWATHLVDEVMPRDDVIVMAHGKAAAQGTVAEVLKLTKTKSIAEAYLKLTDSKA
jgi:ABC-2 type transport system ATP-binding protein